MAKYTVGQVVAITVTFTDVLGVAGPVGALIDPGTVTFTYHLPGSSTSQSPSVTRVSLGTYRVILSLAVAGIHLYHWTSTNNNQGVGQGVYEYSFEVVAQVFLN